ncbi:hypothetical protein [Moraxella oblonga]|uniref:hypothetical protein n=1 Tax=Moraxella oblonga TaxID=200413 RepID=UPI00082E7339|nr:hypothetical protein [Moraxella oblonga]
MGKEKVNFPKAKPTLRVKKKKLELPIEFYYSKISEVYMLIGLIIGMATTFPILATIPDLSDNIWFGLITLILVLVIIYKVVDFCKSMQYENPNIIIKKDCLYLLYDDYALAEFDKMEEIELTSITRSRGGTEFFLKMTIDDEYVTKGKYVNYSMKSGHLYIDGKSIDAYQAFDIIWQVFWNYHEETNYPLRIRNKEEWEWWE